MAVLPGNPKCTMTSCWMASLRSVLDLLLGNCGYQTSRKIYDQAESHSSCTSREKRAQQSYKLGPRELPVRATARSGYMMTSPTFAKWRPRRETRGKVTSWLFAAPRSVLSPYYFESCDFRQWEIRGVKKKCRPMNVCAFLGGKTTEHESFSAQRNAGQGAKHLKKKVSFNFLILEKKVFEIYIKFACWWWSFWCSA